MNSLCSVLDISLYQIQFANIFSHSVGCLFVDGFLCHVKAFKFDIVPCLLLLFVAFAFGVKSKKSSPRQKSRNLLLPVLCLFSSMVPGLTLKSLTHSELIFVLYGVRSWSSLFPQREVTAIYETVLSWLYILGSLCCKLIDHICVGLFLGFLFCPLICLFLCRYHTVLIVIALYIFGNQRAWCLQLCSPFSRPLWLFRFFCGSM